MDSTKQEHHGNEPQRPWEPIHGSKVGWIAGSDETGGVLVDFEGNRFGPASARLALALESSALQEAISARRKAVLLFEDGDPRRPCLIALIHEPSPTPLTDSLLDKHPLPRRPVEAQVDDKRLLIEGKEEVVLRCGQASITLRRNGKVIIRGVQLESYASERNRIKGGYVEIN